ncbi:hypothetical protein HK100_009472 [Physocladia obscura]|uniref:Uncharacterized protein n=1 Tax=Physocladia obscura TaxID=109957 RepID=A0AAD5T5W3_9FUNG|nr:hypothetical protein HK100_009472 [Physocladia obscura]
MQSPADRTRIMSKQSAATFAKNSVNTGSPTIQKVAHRMQTKNPNNTGNDNTIASSLIAKNAVKLRRNQNNNNNNNNNSTLNQKSTAFVATGEDPNDPINEEEFEKAGRLIARHKKRSLTKLDTLPNQSVTDLLKSTVSNRAEVKDNSNSMTREQTQKYLSTVSIVHVIDDSEEERVIANSEEKRPIKTTVVAISTDNITAPRAANMPAKLKNPLLNGSFFSKPLNQPFSINSTSRPTTAFPSLVPLPPLLAQPIHQNPQQSSPQPLRKRPATPSSSVDLSPPTNKTIPPITATATAKKKTIPTDISDFVKLELAAYEYTGDADNVYMKPVEDAAAAMKTRESVEVVVDGHAKVFQPFDRVQVF